MFWDTDTYVDRFRARLVQQAGPNNFRRFVELCEEYTRCVAREAELREAGEVLTMEEYIPLRRNNSAVRLCFSLAEYVLGIDLPDEEMYKNPILLKAYWAACDHVCWANVRFNELFSYLLMSCLQLINFRMSILTTSSNQKATQAIMSSPYL